MKNEAAVLNRPVGYVNKNRLKKNNMDKSKKKNSESIHSNECRFCKESHEEVFVDLGKSPISNNYVAKQDLNKAELFYPLKAFVCTSCFLVQLQDLKHRILSFQTTLIFLPIRIPGWNMRGFIRKRLLKDLDYLKNRWLWKLQVTMDIC